MAKKFFVDPCFSLPLQFDKQVNRNLIAGGPSTSYICQYDSDKVGVWPVYQFARVATQ